MRWHSWTDRDLSQLTDAAVVDELNTLSLASCLLLRSLDELRDGRIYCELLHAAVRAQGLVHLGDKLRKGPIVATSGGGDEGARRRIHAVLAACRQLVPELPRALLLPDCLDRIYAGDRTCASALALLLCRCVDGRTAFRASLQPPTTVHPPATLEAPGTAEEEEILRWLRHVLRQSLRNSKLRGSIELRNVGSVLPAFASGVVLCLLVER